MTPMIRSTWCCMIVTAATRRSSSGSDRSIAAQPLEGVGGVEHRCGTGLDELLLAAERTEHRALGDAGGLGDLTGGQRRAVLAQERDRHLDERRAAVVGAQGRGSGGHRTTLNE